jgi:hypothetical protein
MSMAAWPSIDPASPCLPAPASGDQPLADKQPERYRY